MIKRCFNYIRKALNDENNRFFMESVITFAVLCAVSVVMTVINLFTNKGYLTLATALFSVCCVVDIFITGKAKRYQRVAGVIFSLQILALLSYFLISGMPDGFSAIWICMLPSAGMFFYGRKRGIILNSLMFVIIVAVLWTPLGKMLNAYNYGETFSMRFPILYLAFFFVALFLETVKDDAYENMTKLKEEYKNLSAHDQLTGMLNRQGMYSIVENEETKLSGKVGVVMLDIDHFKKINDIWGHVEGDSVLKYVAKVIDSELKAITCRWGGEEFVAIYKNDDVTVSSLVRMKEKIAEYKMQPSEETEMVLTVSMGIYEAEFSEDSVIDAFINYADEAMYKAKQSGRNRIVHYDSLTKV